VEEIPDRINTQFLPKISVNT